MKELFTLIACIGIAFTSFAQQTEVIAHRGFHATKNSEHNSISSLINAQEGGFYGSECDINETADGVLIAIHGPKHGEYTVQNTDFATLRALKLKNGETLPTFKEYLAQAKKNTDTKLIIEVKSHGTPERETRVVKNILKMVKRAKLKKHVEYIAFSKHVCDELVALGPKGIQIAYLNGNLTPAECKACGYTGIDYNLKVMKQHPEWIQQSHDLGLIVNVWTVNNPEDIKWCIDQKVDYITTDNPLEVNRQLGR
jgi:glycerophosphoryl diester phosphodiesterase